LQGVSLPLSPLGCSRHATYTYIRESFVCATQVADNSPTLIRSYENPEVFGDLLDVKIWEAARATTAATTFFDPVRIGDHGELFADGALHHNNPIHQLYQEARELWPDDDYLLVSIGTGSAPGQSINEGLRSVVEQLAKIATETEETARLFHKNHPELVLANRLFRFNVYHGLGMIGLDESKEMHQIASRTRTYLREPEVVLKAKLCVLAFKTAAAREVVQGNQSMPGCYLTFLSLTLPIDNRSFSTEEDTTYPVFDQLDNTLTHMSIGLWYSSTGATLKHSGPVRSVAFSPDGKLIVSGSYDRSVIVWEVATGILRQTLKGHLDSVRSVAFSPDSKLIASGSDNDRVIIWDVATGTLRQMFEGHSRFIRSVAFSPDSKLIASGSDNWSVIAWEVATGILRQTLKGHIGGVTSVAFSPDGKLLASGSSDKTIGIWGTR
jgi:WD domain, G-beta repeat/Patatin-like phospholipase